MQHANIIEFTTDLSEVSFVVNGQSETNKRRRNCPVSARLAHTGISKTKVAYWRSRLEKQKSKSGAESPDYTARIVHRNRRVRFPLKTSNKEEAASKAATIYRFLVENGWENTLAKFKPKSLPKPEVENLAKSSVGGLLVAARKYSTARDNTFRTYEQALRTLVSEIEGIKMRPERLEEWRAKVDQTPLKKLTPSKIQAWRQVRIANSAKDASGKRSATVTANSLIRNAKALFSKKLLPFLATDLNLPNPLPFEDVQAEKVGSLRYKSRITPAKLMDAADKELKEQSPQVFQVFLLAFVAGLRISEIDYLLWTAFDFEERILQIETTRYHQLKSEDSAGDIDLSDEMVSYFMRVIGNTAGEFVIEVDDSDLSKSSYPYRCHRHFKELRSWLRQHGINAQKPIHTLRKEVGAMIASEQGIYAASRYLRHADIQTTASFYADKKQRVVAPLVI